MINSTERKSKLLFSCLIKLILKSTEIFSLIHVILLKVFSVTYELSHILQHLIGYNNDGNFLVLFSTGVPFIFLIQINECSSVRHSFSLYFCQEITTYLLGQN